MLPKQISKINVPPLKIQGIKTKLVPFIAESIKWDGTGVYYEPFMGSGVVGFNLNPDKAIFSDTNPYIIQFYNDIKDKKISSGIVREYLENESLKLAATPADKNSYYYEVRDRFNKYHLSLDFLFLQRSNFNGMMTRLVYDKLEAITPTKGRGVKEGKDHFGPGKPLYELSATVAPAALVEVAFHDHPDDAKWILENIEPIGTALAKGIVEYFDIDWVDERSELEKAVDVLTETGFILSPQYWKDNAVPGGTINGAYAGLLVKRLASFIKIVIDGLNK